ncbi:MAG: glutamyl-tRNA reductase [Paenibacillaceae bacterium ZCTH02-B3]|nr:MAG: glutamyl-tRNA reductase [Paenibacillaceae bacterium ZCTH02-B3]
MQIVVVGLNYRTAPVEVRERFALSETDLPQALAAFRASAGIREGVILSTCNRTELYAVVDRPTLCGYEIRAFMERWFGIPRREFNHYLYIYEDGQAVSHLFRVTCGLDAMVPGETQVLGQVRDAFLLAQRTGATGKVFNRLFKQAVTLGKRVHHETAIGENAVSVSYAAVELGRRIFGRFDGKRVMLIGAGRMGELAARHLFANGARDIVVANRTPERARELARLFGGQAVRLDEARTHLASVDIVISGTNAPGHVLTASEVREAMAGRKDKPLFLIDIAVPRDIDPACRAVPGVFLYDIDDLQGVVENNLEKRRQIGEAVEKAIEEEREAFARWAATLPIQPVIRALQEKAEAVREATLESLLRKLPDLDERQRKKIDKLTRSMVRQLIRAPILRLKELAKAGRGEEAARFAEMLLDLDLVSVSAEGKPEVLTAPGALKAETGASKDGKTGWRGTAAFGRHEKPDRTDGGAGVAEALPRLAGAAR